MEGGRSPVVRSSEAVKYLCVHQVVQTGKNLCHTKKLRSFREKNELYVAC